VTFVMTLPEESANDVPPAPDAERKIARLDVDLYKIDESDGDVDDIQNADDGNFSDDDVDDNNGHDNDDDDDDDDDDDNDDHHDEGHDHDGSNEED
jgi:hypothetical protein